MPRMITFMLTRLATGFAIGCAVGIFVWQNGFAVTGTIENYLAEALFIYLFASTISMGYLATALLLEE
ncbi:hypothetical protein AMC90_PB00147 (plasmid) [Rhizobium phaseoli]|uniref:hypothetical protein n=1 Tax=Rhizobium phaseoli TaxID=396 RepID=UPI0002E81249|nr:hypothetical protein [Rhizobium phaseoli]ANL30465.1 hypothetical protein AMC90_PB00147 [Rhizobium phaseoli]ANL67985.1 hypothetical protein AMC84_PA00154 [Rhizobium phaseoli]ANL74486.1 hypothetical protein AMC83_PB00156 [Rhizobium phaseoli]ANL80799.1 hypothetical protein AMC82_PA00154 [Rhizobium phaseoli]ANM06622.1 hypothetical protein AMC78_PA00156 [Rhizobium phaseoli]